MSVPGEARKVMQSVLDQWEAVERLGDVSKRVLPPAARAQIDEVTKCSAERTLRTLNGDAARGTPDDAPSRNGTPVPDDEDELTEVRELRLILIRHAGE